MSMVGRPRVAGPREPNGRPQRSPRELSELAVMAGNLRARCREMGIKANEAGMMAARSQMAGCNAGQALLRHINDPDIRSSLFAAVQHMRMVQVRHDAAIGAPRRHAVCLRLLVPVEAMEADASSPAPDDRTPEERARAATTALMQVEGWLGWTDGAAAGECKRVVIDDDRVRDVAGLIRALACVADGLAGERPRWRGKGD